MIYLYRSLYIAGVFLAIKILSIFIDVPVSELAAYTAIVVIADQLSLNRLQRVLLEEKARLEKLEDESDGTP